MGCTSMWLFARAATDMRVHHVHACVPAMGCQPCQTDAHALVKHMWSWTVPLCTCMQCMHRTNHFMQLEGCECAQGRT